MSKNTLTIDVKFMNDGKEILNEDLKAMIKDLKEMKDLKVFSNIESISTFTENHKIEIDYLKDENRKLNDQLDDLSEEFEHFKKQL